jgi:hypothetical protein
MMAKIIDGNAVAREIRSECRERVLRIIAQSGSPPGLVVIVVSSDPASRRAHYGTGFEGMNCGFVTFQQCLDTVRGIGAFCMQNNTYQLPRLLGPRARRARTSLR